VYCEERGTTLDIPLDRMESSLESEEHSSAHSDDVRNFEIVETTGATIVLSYERKIDGRWSRAGTRVTSWWGKRWNGCMRREFRPVFAAH
jgi:hypothetical protein